VGLDIGAESGNERVDGDIAFDVSGRAYGTTLLSEVSAILSLPA
jgi:hypothetical protein